MFASPIERFVSCSHSTVSGRTARDNETRRAEQRHRVALQYELVGEGCDDAFGPAIKPRRNAFTER